MEGGHPLFRLIIRMYIVPLCSGTVHIVAYIRSRIYYLLIAEVNIPLYKGNEKVSVYQKSLHLLLN